MTHDPAVRQPAGLPRSDRHRPGVSSRLGPLVSDLDDQRTARSEARHPTVEHAGAPSAVTILVMSVPASVDQAWLRQFVETGLVASIVSANGDLANGDLANGDVANGDLASGAADGAAPLPAAVRSDSAGCLTVGLLRMDLDELSVSLDGHPIALTHQEFLLLKAFMQSPRRVLSREQLLRQAWDYERWGAGRTVDVHVRRLRAKLGARAPQIVTVHGFGHRLEPRLDVARIDRTRGRLR
jgi:DNA-binding winged helix-turn-helix (wHTH) protein